MDDSAQLAMANGEVLAWHALAIDEVAERLTTSPANGLEANEAAARL